MCCYAMARLVHTLQHRTFGEMSAVWLELLDAMRNEEKELWAWELVYVS